MLPRFIAFCVVLVEYLRVIVIVTSDDIHYSLVQLAIHIDV